MPTHNEEASIRANSLGWWSFAIVVIAIPFSAILFTGAVLLTQICLTSAGFAAAKHAILPAVLTAVVYTLTAIYISPGNYFEVFMDWSNPVVPQLFVWTAFNYGAFTIGLSVGIWRKLSTKQNS